MTATLWPLDWPHEPPAEPFSVVAAHDAMQVHCECDRHECGVKGAAWDVLVAVGHIVPDPNRPQR